jgi:hypothetical protein
MLVVLLLSQNSRPSAQGIAGEGGCADVIWTADLVCAIVIGRICFECSVDQESSQLSDAKYRKQ